MEVITIIEDDNGRVIEGADRLPGGKNCTPGPKMYIHIRPAANIEGKK
jgi:hypothetical protein